MKYLIFILEYIEIKYGIFSKRYSFFVNFSLMFSYAEIDNENVFMRNNIIIYIHLLNIYITNIEINQ